VAKRIDDPSSKTSKNLPRSESERRATMATRLNGADEGRGAGGGGIKRTKSEIMVRRGHVEQLMLKGYIGKDLLTELEKLIGHDHPWSTIVNDIQLITRRWEDEDVLHHSAMRARQRRELYEVARGLRQKDSIALWIRVQELISKVDGTMDASRHKVVTPIEEFARWSTTELEAFAQSGKVPGRLYGKDGELRKKDVGETDDGPDEDMVH